MKIRALAAAAMATMAVAGMARAETMTTGWVEVQMSQEDCIASAQQAIGAVGYSGITTGRELVFGWSGNFGIAVRCISSRGITVYFLYGPDQQANTQLGDRLRPMLQRRAAAPAPAPGPAPTK